MWLKVLLLVLVVTTTPKWSHAAELTQERREAIRQLGEAEALISLCPRYGYSTRNLVEFYADARLPPSLVTSDDEFERLYEEAQEETRMLVEELSEMLHSDPDLFSCVLAEQIYHHERENRPILELTPETIAADRAKAEEAADRLVRRQQQKIRTLAGPVARALMLSRMCKGRGMVVNEKVFRQYAAEAPNAVRTEATRMANQGEVEGLPPVDQACTFAEQEYGPSGTTVKALLNTGK